LLTASPPSSPPASPLNAPRPPVSSSPSSAIERATKQPPTDLSPPPPSTTSSLPRYPNLPQIDEPLGAPPIQPRSSPSIPEPFPNIPDPLGPPPPRFPPPSKTTPSEQLNHALLPSAVPPTSEVAAKNALSTPAALTEDVFDDAEPPTITLKRPAMPPQDSASQAPKRAPLPGFPGGKATTPSNDAAKATRALSPATAPSSVAPPSADWPHATPPPRYPPPRSSDNSSSMLIDDLLLDDLDVPTGGGSGRGNQGEG
ncbi:MAG: hypothetical protein AAFN74_26810, partial [Myxococcota bacterium]